MSENNGVQVNTYYEMFQQCKLERDLLKAQLTKVESLLNELIEDIDTPHRLGLADKPNENWESLNNARNYFKEKEQQNNHCQNQD